METFYEQQGPSLTEACVHPQQQGAVQGHTSMNHINTQPVTTKQRIRTMEDLGVKEKYKDGCRSKETMTSDQAAVWDVRVELCRSALFNRRTVLAPSSEVR